MTTYYIHNLHCDGCAEKATRLLSAVPGVVSVQVSFVTFKAILEMNREVSLSELSQALSETRYEIRAEAPKFGQVFIRWFKKYRPLIVAFSSVVLWTILHQSIVGWSVHYAMHDFMGGFFLVFGSLKVLSWKKFAESYQGYDPLAMKLPVYAYIYPALEMLLGIVYQFRLGEEIIWNSLTVLILGIVTFGIVQVLRRHETIKCACLGGSFNIPITWFTVFENVLMIGMALYMQIIYGAI